MTADPADGSCTVDHAARGGFDRGHLPVDVRAGQSVGRVQTGSFLGRLLNAFVVHGHANTPA